MRITSMRTIRHCLRDFKELLSIILMIIEIIRKVLQIHSVPRRVQSGPQRGPLTQDRFLMYVGSCEGTFTDFDKTLALYQYLSMKNLIFTFLMFLSATTNAKEIAFSFDDVPLSSSKHFTSNARTAELIRKLKILDIPTAIIFANPCRGKPDSTFAQLKKYKDAGHMIGNHTCSHPRLDNVGFDEYASDAEKGERSYDDICWSYNTIKAGIRYCASFYIGQKKVS